MDDLIEKKIPGLKGYVACNDGHVYSVNRESRAFRQLKGRKIKSFENNKGYLIVTLRTDKGQKSFSVHTLVCTAFHGKKPDGYFADHKNRNKKDNRPNNLRWLTPKESAKNRGGKFS